MWPLLLYRAFWRFSHNHKYLCSGKCIWSDVFASTDARAYVNRDHRQYKKVSLTGPIAQCEEGVWDKPCNQVTLSVTNPQVNLTGLYKLGVGEVGRTTYLVHVQVSSREMEMLPGAADPPPDALVNLLVSGRPLRLRRVSKEVTAGSTAKDLKRPDCLVCGTSEPQLATVPFALTSDNEPEGFHCMLELFKTPNSPKYNVFSLLFPVIPSLRPPTFI